MELRFRENGLKRPATPLSNLKTSSNYYAEANIATSPIRTHACGFKSDNRERYTHHFDLFNPNDPQYIEHGDTQETVVTLQEIHELFNKSG